MISLARKKKSLIHLDLTGCNCDGRGNCERFYDRKGDEVDEVTCMFGLKCLRNIPRVNIFR